MNTLSWFIIVVIVILLGAITLIVLGLRRERGRQDDPIADRLAEFSQRGEVASLEEIELSQPFSKRVVIPLLKSLWLRKHSPKSEKPDPLDFVVKYGSKIESMICGDIPTPESLILTFT